MVEAPAMAAPKNPRGKAPERVPGEPAKARIEVRVTQAEKDAIQAGADAAKKNLSDYLRDLALADAVKRAGVTRPVEAPRSDKNRATKPR